MRIASVGGARIYEFPLRRDARERLQARSVEGGAMQAPALPVVHDGGWYHQDAIDAERENRGPGAANGPH